MSIEQFFIHDITISRPGTTTGRGSDVILDWDNATDTETTGWIAQKKVDDIRDNRTGDTAEYVLQTHATANIAPGDRIIWGDDTFDVIGLPNAAYTPRGQHHVEARLRLVEG